MNNELYPSRYAMVNGLRYHYKVAGPADGPLVLLLHGFPEFWYGWRHQIGALAEAGFRVVAPDQRGYNKTERPRGIRRYGINLLAEDITLLMDRLGAEKVFLAGHDWGAAVAWQVALLYPNRVRRLAILNVPHPRVMMKNIRYNRAQRRKSWYIFFFQLPLLPELALRLAKHKGAARMLKSSGKAGTFSAEDLAHYRAAWSQPRAWTGMINWYRALARRGFGSTPEKRVKAPTLIIWGEQDVALETVMAAESLALCDDGRLELVPDATHWVQHDAAELVNGMLVDFFSQSE